MSTSLRERLQAFYLDYIKSGSTHPFLTWIQVQRTGTTYFNPTIQGCSNDELDMLLMQHALGLV